MPKILLAEDDTDMRRFLVKALQNAGFEVISYDNGLSAYQRLREEPFELLLTDIVMPEMDGIELARRASELDPRMFDGRLPSFANTRTMRVAGGLGTVARVVGDAQEIYSQRIPVDDAMRRIEWLYKPYHRAMRRLFTRVHRDFGAAVLVDCHSMPSTAGAKDERPRADIVIGDRYGTSCVAAVAETIDAALSGRGYVVGRNKPYAGGFITEHYGNPAVGLHAIQLEINRALYMDERRYECTASFAALAADLELLADRLADIPVQELRPYRAAAE